MGDIRTKIVIDADTGDAVREFGQLDDAVEDSAKRINEVTDAFGNEGLAGTLQAGIGPLRGVTDELGPLGEQFGMTAQMFTDLGEAGQIYGEQLGFSQDQTAKFATAMGALGLAIGAAQVVWGEMNKEQEAMEQWQTDSVDALTASLREGATASQALAQLFTEQEGVTFSMFGETQNLRDLMVDFNITAQDVADSLAEDTTEFESLTKKMEENGATQKEIDITVFGLKQNYDAMTTAVDNAANAQKFFGQSAEEAAAANERAAAKARGAVEALTAQWYAAGRAARDAQILAEASRLAQGVAAGGGGGGGGSAGSTTVNVTVARTSEMRDVDASIRRWARVDGRQ